MSDDIKTLRAIITHHVMSGTPVQREAFDALERVNSRLELAEARVAENYTTRIKYSLRAKLEIAKEALVASKNCIEVHCPHGVLTPLAEHTCAIINDVMSEISADAPAQSTMRPDAPAQQVEGCRGPWEGIKDRYAPAPAPAPQISDAAVEALMLELDMDIEDIELKNGARAAIAAALEVMGRK